MEKKVNVELRAKVDDLERRAQEKKTRLRDMEEMHNKQASLEAKLQLILDQPDQLIELMVCALLVH